MFCFVVRLRTCPIASGGGQMGGLVEFAAGVRDGGRFEAKHWPGFAGQALGVPGCGEREAGG